MDTEYGNFDGGDNFGGESVTSYQGGETPRETILDGIDSDNVSDFNANNNANNPVNNNSDNSQTNNTNLGAPEQYEPFNFSNGMDTNAPEVKAALSEAEDVFRELNLTQEQAQKLIDLHAKHWIGGAAEMDEQINKQLQAQVDEWGEQTKKDPEFGGARLNQSKMYVNRAISNLGGQKLLDALTKETGVINHPAIWRAFAKIGRDYFTEDKFVQGMNSGRNLDNSPIGMARRVYPDMK